MKSVPVLRCRLPLLQGGLLSCWLSPQGCHCLSRNRHLALPRLPRPLWQVGPSAETGASATESLLPWAGVPCSDGKP